MQDKRSKTDRKIELVCLFTLPTFVQPAVFLVVVWIGKIFFPSYLNHFIDLSIGYQILAFLLLADLTRYLWHRLSYQNRFMWKLHRLHHAVEEMGVLVTFRNTMLFYAFMPGIWFSSTLVFLGKGFVYFILFTHQVRVILLAPSTTK